MLASRGDRWSGPLLVLVGPLVLGEQARQCRQSFIDDVVARVIVAADLKHVRPGAVRTAVGAHRQNYQDLLPQWLPQIELVILIDAREELVIRRIVVEVDSSTHV